MRRAAVAAISVIALWLAGCAGTPTGGARPAQPETGDPDRLLADALRAWALDRDFTTALQLAGRAAAAAPDRPDVAWVHLRLCDAAERCQTPPLETKLKRLAPENGAVWLSVLRRAQVQRDEQAQVPVLEAMSRAQQFDLYWTMLVPRLTRAIAASAPPRTGRDETAPLTAALNEAVSWLASLSLPAFQPLNRACSSERVQDVSRREVCQRISEALRRADTYIGEGVGLGIAQRLAAPGSNAAQTIEREIETLSYRNGAAASVVAAQIERDKFTVEMLELMSKLPREQDVSLAILRWARQPLDP